MTNTKASNITYLLSFKTEQREETISPQEKVYRPLFFPRLHHYLWKKVCECRWHCTKLNKTNTDTINFILLKTLHLQNLSHFLGSNFLLAPPNIVTLYSDYNFLDQLIVTLFTWNPAISWLTETWRCGKNRIKIVF